MSETPEQRRERWRSVAISGSGMPTRKTWLQQRMEREERSKRDMAAYKRMRDAGLQPDRIDGSAEAERHL